MEIITNQDKMLASMQAHPFSKKMKKDQLLELLANAELRTVKKSTLLCEEGKKLDYVFFVYSGLIKIHIRGQVKTQIINLIPPSMIAGLFTVFGQKTVPFSMSTLEESTLIVFKRDFFTDFLQRRPEHLRNFTDYFSEVGGDLISRLILFHQKNIKGKVAYVILYISERIYKTNRYMLPISRKEFGELAGMSSENVIRTLSEFNKEGLMKVKNRDVEILNKEALKRIANYG